MFRGFYTAASGMITQQRRAEMLTNNMANSNTPGFKTDRSIIRSFPEMLLRHYDKKNIPTEKGLNLPHNKVVGGVNTGVYMQEALPSFLQGSLRETELNTDVAISDVMMPRDEETEVAGTVLFTVQNSNGEERFTRNGNFTLDYDGYLTTASGLYVLDNQGERIMFSNDQFAVDPDGFVFDEDGTMTRLGIRYAEDPYRLVKEGDGLYREENDGDLVDAYGLEGVAFNTVQGFVERSNVDPTRTMTDLLATYRSFEANQKVLQAYDRSMEKAASEVGRLS